MLVEFAQLPLQGEQVCVTSIGCTLVSFVMLKLFLMRIFYGMIKVIYRIDQIYPLICVHFILLRLLIVSFNRSICCDLSNVPFTKLVSWLKLAFILSREVPIVFQKVNGQLI